MVITGSLKITSGQQENTINNRNVTKESVSDESVCMQERRIIMSIERVREYLKKYQLENRIMEFDQSSATVDLAAEALGVEPDRIAKTLSFQKEEGCILVVAAGKHKIDNKKFKQTFSMKAKMLSFENALRLTGHAVGGVCPFDLPDGVPVYLDESLKAYDIIFPAAGSSNSAVKLTPKELEESSHAEGWVDVCKL